AAIGSGFPEAFPGVFAACMRAGLDPREQPIPIAAAAHYHMGGIAADPDGRTTLPGLFAVGECAATGVHGANRLASNSLLEAAAFGRRTGCVAATAAAGQGRVLRAHQTPPDLKPRPLARLRQSMSELAGVIRTGPGLNNLVATLDQLDA